MQIKLSPKFLVVALLLLVSFIFFLGSPIRISMQRELPSAGPEAEFTKHVQEGNYCSPEDGLVIPGNTACCSISRIGIYKSDSVKNKIS
jgi:hypothetical protein